MSLVPTDISVRGPLARTPEDLALLLRATAGADVNSPNSTPRPRTSCLAAHWGCHCLAASRLRMLGPATDWSCRSRRSEAFPSTESQSGREPAARIPSTQLAQLERSTWIKTEHLTDRIGTLNHCHMHCAAIERTQRVRPRRRFRLRARPLAQTWRLPVRRSTMMHGELGSTVVLGQTQTFNVGSRILPRRGGRGGGEMQVQVLNLGGANYGTSQA